MKFSRLYDKMITEVGKMYDICNFIPPDQATGEIRYYHFVYETGIEKLRQPFLHSLYYMHLAVKGNGRLKMGEKEYNISPGTVFVTFPGKPFCITDYDNLTYLYISFSGKGVENHFSELGISEENCVFREMEHLTGFWMTQIRRVTPSNAGRIAESVLMHTLSFVGTEKEVPGDKLEIILRYIDSHYHEQDLALKKVADIFFYTEKYLSSLFKKKTGEKFTDYLNNLRIDAAVRHIRNGDKSVSAIAEKCGFSDPYYFSRVFRKVMAVTPTEYIKSR